MNTGKNSSSSGSGGGLAGAARGGVKERRMGTPTKASTGGSRVPERKSTRRVSPRKEASAAAGKKKEPTLSADQRRAVDLVLDGKSVFFTGELSK